MNLFNKLSNGLGHLFHALSKPYEEMGGIFVV